MSITTDIAKIRARMLYLERKIQFQRIGDFTYWGDPAESGTIRMGRVGDEIVLQFNGTGGYSANYIMSWSAV